MQSTIKNLPQRKRIREPFHIFYEILLFHPFSISAAIPIVFAVNNRLLFNHLMLLLLKGVLSWLIMYRTSAERFGDVVFLLLCS